MTKQTRIAQITLGTTADASTRGWRERLNRAFHGAADNAGYVMNKHFVLAASVAIPPVIALANGGSVTGVLLTTTAAGVAGVASVIGGGGGGGAGVGAGVAGVGAGAVGATVAGAAVGLGVASVVVSLAAGLAAQNKARWDGKSDADVQKAGWRATIGTAAGAFAAACMTAGAIHVYGTNMPERAPANAAPKSTCNIKESSGKENIRHNMGKIAVGRAASGAYTLTLPPAAATSPLALAA